jgi:lipid A oxidase
MAAPASAQWYAGVYLGANTTPPADVTVKGPGYDMTFRDVDFEAKSFTSPQYYGWRIGRFLGEDRRLGVELEFIHLKVIAHPEDLGPDVTRYQMTHGLNYLVVNLMHRIPVGRTAYGDAPVSIISRAGAGITLPHAETTIFGQEQEQYEYAGPGAHASIGVNIKLKGRLALMTEYKLTYAKPRISTAFDGTGQTTTLSHHMAVGFTFGISR